MVHPISANANPSGIVTDDAFETIGGMILGAAERQGPIDGVLLHLHGAMVTDSHEDGEGELLERLRRALGPDCPIVVTLDLHANVTQKMADHASALIAFRTYPHIDMYERAWQGAELLAARNAGRHPPAHGDRAAADAARARLGPHAAGADGRADRPRRGAGAGRATCSRVSICAGFARANIRDVGPSVTVTIDMARSDAQRRGQAIAEEFMDHAWAQPRFHQSADAHGRRGGRPAAAREGRR